MLMTLNLYSAPPIGFHLTQDGSSTCQRGKPHRLSNTDINMNENGTGRGENMNANNSGT